MNTTIDPAMRLWADPIGWGAVVGLTVGVTVGVTVGPVVGPPVGSIGSIGSKLAS